MSSAQAQDARNAPSMNLYGSPGLVDMPSGEMMPDATIAGTFSSFGDFNRSTLYFQILPRLSGSFRYSSIDNFPVDNGTEKLFDRSFDLRYQILTEEGYRPSLVVGLRDFIGTGVYSSEYLVATKTFAPGLKATAGIGWGSLGSFNSFASYGSRPEGFSDTGGQPEFERFFQGDVAAFGGLSYAPNDRLTFKLEYSSDDYVHDGDSILDKKSPWNFGLDYKFRNNAGHVSLYHLYGTEIGAQITMMTNLRTAGMGGGRGPSGLPVQPRPEGAAADLGWTNDSTRSDAATASLRDLVAREGMIVEAVSLEGHRATVRLRNPRYSHEPQAIGRAARAMTRALPASVEEFEIVPVVNGMPISSIILQRSDLERLEHAAGSEMLARTQIIDGFNRAPRPDPKIYPKFTWSITPFVQLSVFDPDSPVRADAGLRASGKFEITPNVILSGSVTQKLTGNLEDVERVDSSNLPRVRTDQNLYAEATETAIEYLQVAAYGRPGPNLYSRVTAGYLEQMYGGVSTEILWKPVSSRLALGAEVNYIQRREFDQAFGFQSMVTTDPETGAQFTIPDVNGHVSAYYSFGNGFHGQIDAGRYLAGDYGATLSLDREFRNGFRVGAYATFTDVSAEDFGEGSFDKGIRFTIPLEAILGLPNRQRNDVVIQSLARDGGARLNVRGRLYENVRQYHEPNVASTWGRFWR